MLSRVRLSLCSPDLPTPATSPQRRKSDSSICGSRGLLSHSHLGGRMAVKSSVLSERWSTAFCNSAVWGQTSLHTLLWDLPHLGNGLGPCQKLSLLLESKRKHKTAVGRGCQRRPRLQRAPCCKSLSSGLSPWFGLGLGHVAHSGTVFKASISKHFSAINNLLFLIFRGTLCLYNYWNTYVVDRWS